MRLALELAWAWPGAMVINGSPYVFHRTDRCVANWADRRNAAALENVGRPREPAHAYRFERGGAGEVFPGRVAENGGSNGTTAKGKSSESGGMKPGRQPAHRRGRTVTPGSGHGIAGPDVARSWVFGPSRPCAICQRCAGVTPSDARGLGRAPSSMKGWVLPMLVREGELRVAPVPRNRAFLSGRLCPARKTAPEGEDAGTPPARPPGQRERSRS